MRRSISSIERFATSELIALDRVSDELQLIVADALLDEFTVAFLSTFRVGCQRMEAWIGIEPIAVDESDRLNACLSNRYLQRYLLEPLVQ